MALKKLKKVDALLEVNSEADAVVALTRMRELQNEIDTLMRKHGITDLMEYASNLKKTTTEWAVSEYKGKEFQIQGKGFHATLISQAYDSHFIGTKDDMPDEGPAGRTVVPLRTIIYRKFKDRAKAKKAWMAVTTRVPDKAKIEEAVAEGLLAVDEIAPSFVEKRKAPYLRVFDDV